MPTPAEVLASLSPLPSGTPAEHLLAIIVGGGAGNGVSVRIVGVVRDVSHVAGVVSPAPSVVGVVSSVLPVAGIVRPSESVFGLLSRDRSLRGIMFGVPTEGEMADLSMTRGDSLTLNIVIINDPATVAGSWTWNGSTVVLSTSTTGVSAGDWIRLPVVQGNTENNFFKVATVVADTSVTIENPYDLSIPSGSGVERSTVVDLTGSVVKFSVKEYSGQANSDAVVFKSSYSADEINLTDPAAGEATIEIFPDDTSACEVGSFPYDVEATRPGATVSVSGTASFSLSSNVITFSSPSDVALARVGDLITPSGLPGNNVTVTITETPSTPGSVLTSTQLRTDFPGFVTESGVSFTLRRGIRKTPSGLRGVFTIEPDTTT